ncbi:MAG: phosphodiester glycosidase family protein [Butyrivibrio sp.]|uniref:phosphodiester glycosidase family protein n=1 Tax=Butyrivibrio sp. TaxID=28121 RepID=UPI001B515AEC|nr:phosphodiester glycosidase family protein [Butyrivibrio sp.]MBP3781856.1 phosphodiester glycosidase family protein [Butyrivibrio sp.]
MKRIALIPAYMPDDKLITIVRQLYEAGFEIIIVNDGSSDDCIKVFEESSRYAKVLCHEKNQGKGKALKTGLKFINSVYEAPYTIVTVDADGQHRIEDVIRVAQASEQNRSCLILGSRKMEGKVPFKSLAGNAITRFVYRLSTGISVYDTQTGLRAFSDKLIPRLIEIDGSRYEYEMNMLTALPREGVEIKEVWISTVYIDDNKSSHFNAVKDSFLIYREILKFSASSFVSFIVDYCLFCLLSALGLSLVFANVTARIFSGTINYTINKRKVFKSRSGAASALKYALLAAFIIICNTLILEMLTGMNMPYYTAKILTEIVLFALSYLIQRRFIFTKGRNHSMKKNLWPVVSAILLTTFTIYITLDTFVISKGYDTNATEINTAMFADIESPSGTSEAETVLLTDESSESEATANTSGDSADASDSTTTKHRKGSGRQHSSSAKTSGTSDDTSATSAVTASAGEYSGENTVSTDDYTITLSDYYQNGTKIYVADVTLSSARYLKTAFADDTYGKNVTATTSSIAEDNDAVLAINGDYYGVQESGYVIRNGVVYRSTANGSDVLCIYADGTMEVVNDAEYTAEELVSMGVWQAFTFGPALIENSEVAVDTNTEVDRAKTSNPRTAIGVIDANHFVFVVSDGRTDESEGLSLYELANFMKDLGVTTAYNLDGGGSSTMYFNGYVINNPTSGGSIKERSVSDIVYI